MRTYWLVDDTQRRGYRVPRSPRKVLRRETLRKSLFSNVTGEDFKNSPIIRSSSLRRSLKLASNNPVNKLPVIKMIAETDFVEERNQHRKASTHSVTRVWRGIKKRKNWRQPDYTFKGNLLCWNKLTLNCWNYNLILYMEIMFLCRTKQDLIIAHFRYWISRAPPCWISWRNTAVQLFHTKKLPLTDNSGNPMTSQNPT